MENEREPCWIVDWDIPTSVSASQRVAFYRALKRLRKKFNVQNDMSTQSVLKTTDEALARAVFDLASVYGRCNLYWVVKMKTTEKQFGPEENML